MIIEPAKIFLEDGHWCALEQFAVASEFPALKPVDALDEPLHGNIMPNFSGPVTRYADRFALIQILPKDTR